MPVGRPIVGRGFIRAAHPNGRSTIIGNAGYVGPRSHGTTCHGITNGLHRIFADWRSGKTPPHAGRYLTALPNQSMIGVDVVGDANDRRSAFGCAARINPRPTILPPSQCVLQRDGVEWNRQSVDPRLREDDDIQQTRRCLNISLRPVGAQLPGWYSRSVWPLS